ncbi:FGGY-family carbohydrate kinase [Jannaschia sp. LMIT008]|uniref:FGGY family carbohydrate kinase n=1 Tax=Jannaschia maritima TaxID=3032585 RepID=UPI00281216D5|nr:FGGY-family carbohydrate kinase [Jannaschia sp. LMIT008]
MADGAILAIDEGTTNAKAVMVALDGAILATGSAPLAITHPRPGWVEQDADAIWDATRHAVSDCLAQAGGVQPVAIGVSNQRESVLIWDRRTGQPLGPVITWQCRRTADVCAALREAGHEPDVIARTGLPLDPLFPATKARWLLDHHAPAGGEPLIGTVDSWLIWKLTGGAVHATDCSNASRTQLLDLALGDWDRDLCGLFGIDPAMLPAIHDSAHVYGRTDGVDGLPDGVPVASAIGDSHAALFAHGAFAPGSAKATFGTGSSVMIPLDAFAPPPPGITTTIAWSLEGRSTYALEGNILVSASILPWTAALLGLDDVDAVLALADTVSDAGGVSLVPAHVGLGSPHWVPDARGLIDGLTFGVGPAQITRAAVDSIALQVCDVLAAMENAAPPVARLSADGGPSRNRALMGRVADLSGRNVAPCAAGEASAMGAAYLAGLAIGLWPDLNAIAAMVRHDDPIPPAMGTAERTAALDRWRKAVARAARPS